MSSNSVSADQLTEGTTVLIRGKLHYARLASLIEGQDLVASDQRRRQHGMIAVGVPHTAATITAAEVQYADPANPTLEERFVAERCYPSAKDPGGGKHYAIESKGTSLPVIGIPSRDAPGTFTQDHSGQELARGLDVTLVLRVYKPKGWDKRGIAIERVLVHEAPRYYSPGISASELAARGIVFSDEPRAVQAGRTDGTAVAGAGDTAASGAGGALPLPVPQPAAASALTRQPPGSDAVPAQREQVETQEERLARLERENQELRNAGSPVGAPVATGTGSAGPGDGREAGVVYQPS